MSEHVSYSLLPFEIAIMDIAKAYGFGTPQSRAIVTALDHARAVCPAPPRKDIAE